MRSYVTNSILSRRFSAILFENNAFVTLSNFMWKTLELLSTLIVSADALTVFKSANVIKYVAALVKTGPLHFKVATSTYSNNVQNLSVRLNCDRSLGA